MTVHSSIPSQPDARAAAIRGLRSLVDFLEAHPDLPLPSGGLDYCTLDERDEIERVAEILETGTRDHGGTFETDRHFGGGIMYRAFLVAPACLSKWRALMTYSDAVSA
jgi:hypothetical protein